MKIVLLILVIGCLTIGCQTLPSDERGYNANLSQVEYPFSVHFLPIDSQQQQLNMAYMYQKPLLQSKGTVLLLHGKNFNAAYWEDTANVLLAQGYAVVMPDQIGFGKSSKPEHYAYSFHTFAEQTMQIVDTLDIDTLTVVGHSMGGMLATRFSLMYPNRVNKLILVNPIGLEDYSYYAKPKDINFFFESEKSKKIENIIAYQRKNYYDGQWNDKYESLTDIHRGWIEGPDWSLMAWNNALTYAPVFNEPVVHELQNLTMDLHLILGTRDRTGPGRNWAFEGNQYELGRYDLLGKALQKKHPNIITLYELEGLGHLPQVENLDRFTHTFLQALDAD